MKDEASVVWILSCSLNLPNHVGLLVSLTNPHRKKSGRLHHTLPTLFAVLRGIVPCITWPARSPNLTPPDFFFLWVFGKYQVYRTPVRGLENLQRIILLLSTMSHYRCFITHGSRLNTGCTFPVPLMDAMLRFMERKVNRRPLSLLVAIGYIYIFVLVHKL